MTSETGITTAPSGSHSVRERSVLGRYLVTAGTVLLFLSLLFFVISYYEAEKTLIAFVQQHGTRFPQSQVFVRRGFHLADAQVVFALGAAIVGCIIFLDLGHHRLNESGRLAVMLGAVALVIALFIAYLAKGGPIDTCLQSESCPLDLSTATTYLSAARYCLAGTGVLYTAAVVRMVPRGG